MGNNKEHHLGPSSLSLSFMILGKNFSSLKLSFLIYKMGIVNKCLLAFTVCQAL